MIFGLRDAGAGSVPFLFEFPLANFQAELFAAQTFELKGEVFALLREGTSLVENRCYLLLKRGFAAFELGALLVQPPGQSFGGHEPLVHCRELGTAGGKLILFRLDGAAKHDEFFRESRAFGLGFGAAQGGGSMLVLRMFRPLPGVLHVLPAPCPSPPAPSPV